MAKTVTYGEVVPMSLSEKESGETCTSQWKDIARNFAGSDRGYRDQGALFHLTGDLFG